jgi:PAS domain S-box-containing protein
MSREGHRTESFSRRHGDSDDPITVLHVDDEPDFAELVGTFLERSHDDIDVVTATDAGEGLDVLSATVVDCIVSDYDMPGRNGLEFLEVVREQYPRIPFVLFTGKGNEEIASDAISAGVTEYLQKGGGTDQYTVLANRIERAVEEYRAKSALKESERMFSTLVSNLPGMAYRCRNAPDWPMEFVSEGCRELTGYGPEALTDGDVSWSEDVLEPADNERLWAEVQTALDRRESFEVTYPVVTAEGTERQVWEQGCGVYEDGELIALEGIVLDVSEALSGLVDVGGDATARRDLEQYRTLVENVGDAMYVLDTEGRIEMINRAMADYLGRDREAILGDHVSTFMAEPDVEHGTRLILDLLESDRSWDSFEMEVIHADGSRSLAEDKIAVLTDDEGEFVGSVGVIRDITERKARERELRRYETIIQAVGDPVFAADADGTLTFVNDAVTDLLGYDPDDLLGEHATELVAESDYDETRRHVRQLLDDDALSYATFELELFASDGTQVPTEVHLALLDDADSFEGTAGVIRDITERKQREQHLEEFASVVSHDLQSPLNVIEGRAELAVETGDVDHVENILSAAARMDRLVEDLLALAREGRTVGDTEPVVLSSVADRAWMGIETGDSELLVESGPTVEADPDRLTDLLSNLFQNSLEHSSMSGPGRDDPGVTVRVGELDDPGGFYVADDGSGIDPDQRERVFDDGYTTSQSGTGLGLAIVENIAAAHGWAVRVTDSEHGGARFEVVTA